MQHVYIQATTYMNTFPTTDLSVNVDLLYPSGFYTFVINYYKIIIFNYIQPDRAEKLRICNGLALFQSDHTTFR